ncbi:MAG: GspH/FimT family pseudopilin [Propionivibrio sp.]|uniref:Type II secretion system protein H n=1 Tax=Candidatus Propionivibrio dominans TaxID=2954373 RepID=A0A9D7FEL0_9RHOO|nr:GspH/FimT family pseudopilin [Candidatus Propionivibrio dominans]
MIELLIGVAVLGILLALGASSFRVWIGNMRIRTTAEAIQNGLQLARGEAVRRNALVRFQLVNDLTAGCADIDTSNRIVSYDNPAGACDAALLRDDVPVNDAAWQSGTAHTAEAYSGRGFGQCACRRGAVNLHFQRTRAACRRSWRPIRWSSTCSQLPPWAIARRCVACG